jgi:hypothetical membrane protein
VASRRQAQASRNLRQEEHELISLARAEPDAQPRFVGGHHLGEPPHHVSTQRRQVQRPDATVARIGTPAQQPAPLQIVDQRDDAARRNMEHPRDRKLRLALRGRHLQEHVRLPTVDTERHKAVGPDRVRVVSERRKEEPEPVRWQAISDLGIGENAWLLNGSLVILGVALVAFTLSFYHSMRPLAGRAFRLVCAVLLASVGVGFAVAGIFDETNPLHWQLGAPLVYGGAAFGFLVAGLLLRRDPAWRGWGNFSLLASLTTIVLIGLTFYTFASYTYSPDSPGTAAAEGQLAGFMERVLFIEILAWYVVFGWRLFRAPPTES